MPYHDHETMYSQPHFHKVLIVADNAEEATHILTRPMMDEDGEACVGIYSPTDNKLVGRLRLHEYEEDGEDRYMPQFFAEDAEAFDAYQSLQANFKMHCSYEMWLACLPQAASAHWFEDEDAEVVLNRDTWTSFLWSNMPNAVAMQSGDWTSIKSKDMRGIVNALGLKPLSIKRDDCYNAIVRGREEFENEGPVLVQKAMTSNEMLHIAIVAAPPARPNAAPRKFYLGSDGQGTWSKITELCNHSMLPLKNVIVWHPHSRFSFRSSMNINTHGTNQINSLLAAGADLESAERALRHQKESCWFANQQTNVLREAITDLQNKMDESDRKRNELLATIQATTPVVLPEGEGTVTVMGKEFPFFNHPDAPSAIDNYSLEYWTASMRVGPGADTVTFDATDFIGAVLVDPVLSVVGAPGTGKTTICRQVAHVLGVPCFIVQFTRDKPIEQLIGVDKIRGGEQVFVDGEITVAMRAAAANPNVIHIIGLDEFDHAASEVQSDLHGVVEGRDYTLPNGEVIKNHGNLRFVLTRNTTGHGDQNGRHASANISDSAFNSRIKSAFMVDYMKPIHEQVLLTVHGLDTDEAEQVVKFANATRQSVKSLDSGESFDGMSEPVCLRHLIGYAQARSRGVTKPRALAMSILSHLPEGDRPVANEMIVSHIQL